MSAQELTDWIAFDRLHPYALRADRRAAMLAATIANSAGGKKDGGSFGLDDFVPDLCAAEVDQDATDMRAAADAILKTFDVVDLRASRVAATTK